MRACFHPGQNLRAKIQKSLSNAFDLGPRMPSLQCRQLLAKNEILQKESTMSAEEAKDCTYQESDGICHARGAIACRLWRATFHEITSGHNFGEGQGHKIGHSDPQFIDAIPVVPRWRERAATPCDSLR